MRSAPRFAAFLLALALPAAALAQSPDGEAGQPGLTPLEERADIVALMAEYAGEWVGRGTSRMNFDDPMEAASCRMTAVFDVEADTLTNEGRCANTQRAIDIDGDLTITEEGDLTGGFFSRFEVAELLSSSGEAYEEGFIVEARYLAEIQGDTQEVDARVSVGRPDQTGGGDVAFSMVIAIENPETGEFVSFSEIVFNRRD